MFYLCCWFHNRVLLFPQTGLREYSAPDLFVIDAVVNLSIKTENPAGPISFLKFVFKPSKIPVFVCCLISPQALLDNVIITRQSISKTKKIAQVMQIEMYVVANHNLPNSKLRELSKSRKTSSWGLGRGVRCDGMYFVHGRLNFFCLDLSQSLQSKFSSLCVRVK